MSGHLHNAEIYSIQIGDPSDKIMFQVGKDVFRNNKKLTISRIERNENFIFDGNGCPIYEVYATDEKNIEHLINYFERHKIYVSLVIL